MLKKLSFFFATLFYTGYFPKAPGTIGSLASFVLIIPSIYFGGTIGLLSLCLLATIIGFISTNEVLKHTEHDPKFVVIDELAGQAITFLPFAYLLQNMHYNYIFQTSIISTASVFVTGFVLFRLFDILKPSLVGYFDKKLESSAGVMLDDIAAGLFASLCLTLYLYILLKVIY